MPDNYTHTNFYLQEAREDAVADGWEQKIRSVSENIHPHA